MKIQVLGSGCSKCGKLYKNAVEAVSKSGVDATIEKVEKINEIMKFGVPFTPAIVIDGNVKAYGSVPGVSEIVGYIT